LLLLRTLAYLALPCALLPLRTAPAYTTACCCCARGYACTRRAVLRAVAFSSPFTRTMRTRTALLPAAPFYRRCCPWRICWRSLATHRLTVCSLVRFTVSVIARHHLRSLPRARRCTAHAAGRWWTDDSGCGVACARLYATGLVRFFGISGALLRGGSAAWFCHACWLPPGGSRKAEKGERFESGLLLPLKVKKVKLSKMVWT
jgi:hypothetical protein